MLPAATCLRCKTESLQGIPDPGLVITVDLGSHRLVEAQCSVGPFCSRPPRKALRTHARQWSPAHLDPPRGRLRRRDGEPGWSSRNQ
jgi:hypothetical protein